MTNFAKRTMMEQNIIQSIPSEGPPAKKQGTGNTFDDDYEPVRPAMKNQQKSNEGYPQPPVGGQYDNFAEAQSYDDSGNPAFQGSRQGSSIGMTNRSTRMMAQQNYRMSQGQQSRKSNARSVYDGSDTSATVHQRGTTSDRAQRAKNGMSNTGPQSQYYMINSNGTQKQGAMTNVPVSTKKKSSSSNYTGQGMSNNHKQMNYAGSLSGSLQHNKDGLVDSQSYNKSPMLNTGKKMSNTSLQRGYNRSNGPQGNQNTQARTAANWMQKQAPTLSPTRNGREISSRINTEDVVGGKDSMIGS